MATDQALNQADSDSLEVWAPTHAWRTLGQLAKDAEIPAAPLLELLNNPYDDWAREESPIVMGLIGSAAIPAIEEYWASQKPGSDKAITLPSCFEHIAIQHPNERARCLDCLVQQLTKKGL